MRRRHEPDIDAAAYVSGLMRPRERRRFERHLLTCDACWQEVRLDREGRLLAEGGREAAPSGLRDSVRAAVAAGAEPGLGAVDIANTASARRRRSAARPDWALGTAAAALVVLLTAGALVWSRGPHEPAPISAALDAYSRSVITATDHHMTPPDLTEVGLTSTGAETMALADMPVEAFAYRTSDGKRLTLFMAHETFPRAIEAGVDGATWLAHHDGLTLASSTAPVSYLVVSTDAGLVSRFQGAVGDGSVVIS